jgi:hypothetical protein
MLMVFGFACSKKQPADKPSQTEQNQSLQASAEQHAQTILDINSDDPKLKRAVEKTLNSKQSQRRPK